MCLRLVTQISPPIAREQRRLTSMTADRWTVIKALLARALELPEAARPRFVDDVAGRDPEAAAELRALLAAHARMGTFLEDRG